MSNNSFKYFFDFIKKYEGFSSKPYWDYRQYTWGYGTKTPDGKEGSIITKAEAESEVRKDFEARKKELSKVLKKQLNPNQWAALLSFSYNLGISLGKKMAEYINTLPIESLRSKWYQYVYAGGKINKGLIDRRRAEFQLFIKK